MCDHGPPHLISFSTSMVKKKKRKKKRSLSACRDLHGNFTIMCAHFKKPHMKAMCPFNKQSVYRSHDSGGLFSI